MMTVKTFKITQIILLPILVPFITQAFTAMATPTAPVILVNHILKQCAEHVILGDECYYCTPAEGWEILDFTQQCPSGYTKTDNFLWSCAVHTPPSIPYSECEGANITITLLTPASVNSKPVIETNSQNETISSIKSDTVLFAGLAILIVVVGILVILIGKKAA